MQQLTCESNTVDLLCDPDECSRKGYRRSDREIVKLSIITIWDGNSSDETEGALDK